MFRELHLRAIERMGLPPFGGDFEHREEFDARMVPDVTYQALEHQQAMAAADHLRMHRQRVHAFARRRS